jgi:hypothetical protein
MKGRFMFTDYRKPISQLNMSDFEVNPLWSWEDDDDKVIPINTNEVLPDEYDAVFAKCEIIMRDGTKINGVVAARMSNQEVYLISFPGKNGNLLDIPLQPWLAEQKESQLKKLCNWFAKPLSSIFPLEFKTSFRFSDGTLLKGKING